ncbi:hypothetical protein DYI37_11275 [Fulvimarina endophytica]|uniref:Lipoprotein n=1 Tax=Fulvimarina endophytica TaxID=2293836 RepID=A0A371X2Z1_9HYPH|nr:hypothetical protein [Fulvimarina endophytica]RFC63583.1 hypothetical protein DYI37_11275 [Fulvimarina endophytica]
MTIKAFDPHGPRLILAGMGLALLALGGCNSAAPYPLGSPIEGARISANPYPPGSPEFCRQYARQSAANQYETIVDRGEDGFGMRALKEHQARRDGARAYRRCIEGRLR